MPDAGIEQLDSAHIHRRHFPSMAELGGRHLMYVFGNPMNAVVSFFARRESISELHGFDCRPGKGKKHWAVLHCRNLEVEAGPMTSEWDLRRYLDHGEDPFRLEKHFDDWTNPSTGAWVLLVRYETMWDHFPEIFRFAEIPDSHIPRVPQRRPRGSDWRDLPTELRSRLEDIHGSLHERILAQPDVRIIGDGQSSPVESSGWTGATVGNSATCRRLRPPTLRPASLPAA